MNKLGQEGWRVIQALPNRANEVAERGLKAVILVLFERQITAPP